MASVGSNTPHRGVGHRRSGRTWRKKDFAMLSMKPRPDLPRRIVTGIRDGKSVILSDGAVPSTHRHVATPGLMSAVLWTTAAVPQLSEATHEPAPPAVRTPPELGGTSLLVVRFPPDAVMAGPRFDFDAAGVEGMQRLPGLAELFEHEQPGMHSTDFLDYGIVLDGDIWLELGDGVRTLLTAGDIAVQCGTRHAWCNKSDRATTMAFVLIGARRS